MTDDDDFDDRLAAQFAGDDELPDAGFSAAIVARIERHHRRRRQTLVAAAVVAALGAVTASAWIPAAALAGAVTPGNAIAALVLAAACSMIWIATEPAVDLRRLR